MEALAITRRRGSGRKPLTAPFKLPKAPKRQFLEGARVPCFCPIDAAASKSKQANFASKAIYSQREPFWTSRVVVPNDWKQPPADEHNGHGRKRA